MNEEDYLKKSLEYGASKSFIVNPKMDILFHERVRLICANSCGNYGVKLTCPPNIPPINYEKAIKEYSLGILVVVENNFINDEDFTIKRKSSTNNLHNILLQLEKDAFSNGHLYTTSFIGGSCKLCDVCGTTCKKPSLSRIPLEATGVDVVETMKNFLIDLKFPVKKYNNFKRVGLFLIE